MSRLREPVLRGNALGAAARALEYPRIWWPLIAGVENDCQIGPFEASKEINSVIDQRQAILSELAGLTVTGNAEANNLTALLQRAVELSNESNRHYQDWMNYLYTAYYYTFPIGCPNGAPPHNADWQAGVDGSGAATSAKQTFTAAFNPVAGRFGLRQWDPGEF